MQAPSLADWFDGWASSDPEQASVPATRLAPRIPVLQCLNPAARDPVAYDP